MSDLADVNYPLDQLSAVRHVALALDKAAPAALSFSDLARDYHHPIPADLKRVMRSEGFEETGEAIEWLFKRAVAHLGKHVEVINGTVAFANGHKFEDIRFNGAKLHRPGPDFHAQLRDPFNPMTGAFSDNIREELRDGKGKDPAWDELYESMQKWGWISEFPALVDERGVMLVGHRRAAIAKELGIAPVTKTLHLGVGDAADAERFKLAIASNIGGKKLSPNDRKRIAIYLYTDHDWSQQKIAEALAVSQSQVQRDLSELPTTGNSKRGRPKSKSLVKAAAERRDVTPEQEKAIADLTEQGLKRDEIVEKVGVGSMGVRLAQQRHLGRLEERAAQEEAKPVRTCTCPACGHIHAVD